VRSVAVIHSIRMRNWRSYDDAEIDLDHPLVFFVAPNGVGKSSLYEAVQRCLLGFPSTRDSGRSVRSGADSATLDMELTIGEHRVSVTRTVTRGGRTAFEASCDGRSIDEPQLRDLLSSAWAADWALIDRLAFGDLDPGKQIKATLPIREHLADLMGVTPLLEAATELRTAQVAARKRVTGLREDVSGSQEAIDNATAALGGAEDSLSHVASAHTDLSRRIEQAESLARAADAWSSYRSAAALYTDEAAELVAEMSQRMNIEVADPAIDLDAVRTATERDLRSARDAQTESTRRAAQSTAAADVLGRPVENCPTCLRPLGDEERIQALQSHGSSIQDAEAAREEAAVAIDKVERRLRDITHFTRQFDRLTPPNPPEHEDPGPRVIDELAELRAQGGALSERLGEARAHRDSARRTLELEQANVDDARRLNRAAREELLFETMAGVFERVANHYLSERIEPLTQDVAHRWKLLMGQEGLVLEPTGEFRLTRGTVDLQSSDMSGGERAIAGIVVRLLVTAAATRIPTSWYDEPLEHLDPRRRAAVAQTLVSAAATGAIDQIVVTTYEERMVQQLASAAPELVTIVYADSDLAETENLTASAGL